MTMTPMSVSEAVTLRCELTQPWEVQADVLVLVVASGAGLPSWLAGYEDHLTDAEDGCLTIPRGAGSSFRARIVEVVTLSADESARERGRAIGASHRTSTTFALSGLAGAGQDSDALAFITGLTEARYEYGRYLSKATAGPADIALIDTSPRDLAERERELAVLQIVESAVALCRDLTNTPARDLTPIALADEAVRVADISGATATVFDESWLRDEGFDGLVSVGGGSPHPPRLVEVTYRGRSATNAQPIVLVGKGITFDSGGLSLKRASSMVEMKSDMAGAATVLAVVCAIAQMELPDVHVTALLALAENIPGPNALRPGDILHHRNHKTTEVVNTDCEGRLVMSDVLTWGQERNPSALIDVATLTYSTISAVGLELTSVIGSDPALIADIRAAGGQTGDEYWELPLWKPYRRLIDSPFADLRNEEIGEGAGAITAALYLKEFVGSSPWAHLDTGGTAYLDEPMGNMPVGATGAGVRSLIRLVLNRQHEEH